MSNHHSDPQRMRGVPSSVVIVVRKSRVLILANKIEV
jgi:hypothetical protein